MPYLPNYAYNGLPGSSYTNYGVPTMQNAPMNSLSSSGSSGFSMDNMSSYLGLAQATTNIFSGINKYHGYNDAAKAYANSSSAVWEEYRINDLAMRRSAVKQFGELVNVTGEGGSAMDLLQESSMNFALDSWRLKFNAEQKYNMLKKQEKAAKKAGKGALGGAIGSAVGIVAGVALGVMTGGVGFAALAGAGALGGMVGQGVGSTVGMM